MYSGQAPPPLGIYECRECGSVTPLPPNNLPDFISVTMEGSREGGGGSQVKLGGGGEEVLGRRNVTGELSYWGTSGMGALGNLLVRNFWYARVSRGLQ